MVSSTVGPTLTNIQNFCTAEKNIYIVHRTARVRRLSPTNIQYLMYKIHCTMQRMVNSGRPGLTNIHGRWQTNIQDHLLQGVALDADIQCIHTISSRLIHYPWKRRSYRQIHDVYKYTNTQYIHYSIDSYTSFEDEWLFRKSLIFYLWNRSDAYYLLWLWTKIKLHRFALCTAPSSALQSRAIHRDLGVLCSVGSQFCLAPPCSHHENLMNKVSAWPMLYELVCSMHLKT